jgi:hypothetical protein
MEIPEVEVEPTTIYNTATEALENIGKMANEMENTYKEKIEILELQVEDMSRIAERYLVDNETLTDELDDYRRWHKTSNMLPIALSLLMFVYGLVFGVYLNREQQEL